MNELLLHWGEPEAELYAALHQLLSQNVYPKVEIYPKAVNVVDQRSELHLRSFGRIILCGTRWEKLDQNLGTVETDMKSDFQQATQQASQQAPQQASQQASQQAPQQAPQQATQQAPQQYTILVYRPEDMERKKYGPNCKYLLLSDELAKFEKDHPWTKHIVRRMKTTSHRKDREFYYGLHHYMIGRHQMGLSDVFAQLISGPPGTSYKDYETLGAPHLEQDETVATEQVKRMSAQIKIGPLDATAMIGTWYISNESILEELASPTGVGVLITYDLKNNCTMISVYAVNKKNAETVRNFISKAPFNGYSDMLFSYAICPTIVPFGSIQYDLMYGNKLPPVTTHRDREKIVQSSQTSLRKS